MWQFSARQSTHLLSLNICLPECLCLELKVTLCFDATLWLGAWGDGWALALTRRDALLVVERSVYESLILAQAAGCPSADLHAPIGAVRNADLSSAAAELRGGAARGYAKRYSTPRLYGDPEVMDTKYN